MRSGRARRRDAVVNDERILDAGIEVITSVGVDQLTTSNVASTAGLTTGAIYGRYLNREELLAEVWLQRCGPRLRELVVDLRAATLRPEGADAARQRVLAALTAPDARLRAAVELCVVTPRTDELVDVVPADVAGWFGEAGGHSSGDAAGVGVVVELGLFAEAVGWLLLSNVAGARSPDWSSLLARTAAPPPAPTWDAPQRLGGVIELDDELTDPVRRALIDGGNRVVARSGVSRATLSRIARAGGLPPTAVYAHYDDRLDFIVDLIRQVDSWLMRDDDRARLFSSPRVAEFALSQWLADPAAQRRRVMVEFTLAAAHQREIADAYADAHFGSSERAAKIAGEMTGQPEPAEEVVAVALCLILGSAVLAGLGDLVVGRDWRQVVDIAMAPYALA